MGNLFLPSLLLLLLLLLSAAAASTRFDPPDNHLVDCGVFAPTTLDDGRVFLPDAASPSSFSSSTSPGFLLLPALTGVSVADPNPTFPPPYGTARVFTKPSSYRFHIKHNPNGGAAHLVRLHFYPFSPPESCYNLSSARFHVVAGHSVLLSNFAPPAASPIVKEYILRAESDQLEITFVPADASPFAFVNAIEVFSAPADLISDLARSVSTNLVENFALSRQTLETIHRINVGGPKVTPFNDTLWRTWIPDEDAGFVKKSGGSASRTMTFGGRVQYQIFGASREVAPDSVYNTARVTETADSPADSDMSWSFRLSSGYKYLVRMHFCDIASLALNELFFNITINGDLAWGDFDLSEATGQVLASPYYVDFLSSPDSMGFLTLSIGPSRPSSPFKISGLLNGLEIFKINNSMCSLDGEVSVLSVLESPRRGGFAVFARSLLCGFAFMSLVVVVFMLVLRLRAGSTNSVAWSHLPVDVSEGKLGYGNLGLSGKSVNF